MGFYDAGFYEGSREERKEEASCKNAKNPVIFIDKFIGALNLHAFMLELFYDYFLNCDIIV